MGDNIMSELDKLGKVSEDFEVASDRLRSTSLSPETAERLVAGTLAVIQFAEDDPSSLTLQMATHAVDLLMETALARQEADRNYSNFQQALIDPLTGLPDRKTLSPTYDRVTQRMKDGKIGGLTVAVVDVNDFKTVNDYLGHDVGDRVLQAIAHTMRSVVPESDYIARTGGDEFTIFIEHRSSKPEDEKDFDWVNPKAMDILCAIQEKINNTVLRADHPKRDDVEVPLGITIGAHTADPNVSMEQNIKLADKSLYRAKSGKKDIYAELRRLGPLKQVLAEDTSPDGTASEPGHDPEPSA